MVTSDSVPIPVISTVHNQCGGSAMLVNRYGAFELDEVSQLMWRLADGTRSIAEIATDVAAERAEDVDVVRRDAVEFFDQLAGVGLIEIE